MIPDGVGQFVRSTVRSVWALELLLFMRRRATAWSVDDLARELRSNRTIVVEALADFDRAGLVREEGAGAYRYAPATPELANLVQDLERVYAERPIALVKEIVSAPNSKIQSFADAFRLKKE